MRESVMVAAEAFLKGAEGLRLKAYQDGGGVWTIGYGHTGDVSRTQVIDPKRADELLRGDVMEVCRWLDLKHPEVASLSDHRAACIVSWVFNCGCALVSNASLWRVLKEDPESVPKQLRRWVYDNGVKVPGLVNRRNKEIRVLWEHP